MMIRHLGTQIKTAAADHSLTVDMTGIRKALVVCRFETNATASGKTADWRIFVYQGKIAAADPYESDEFYNFGTSGLTYNDSNGRVIHPGLTKAAKDKRFAAAVDVVFLLTHMFDPTLNVQIKSAANTNSNNVNSITIFGVETLHSS